MLECIIQGFYWTGADVQRYCAACPECQLTQPQGPPPLQNFPIVMAPFEQVEIDIVGPIFISGGGVSMSQS